MHRSLAPTSVQNYQNHDGPTGSGMRPFLTTNEEVESLIIPRSGPFAIPSRAPAVPFNSIFAMAKWRIATSNSPWLVIFTTNSDAVNAALSYLEIDKSHVVMQCRSESFANRLRMVENIFASDQKALAALEMPSIQLPILEKFSPRLLAMVPPASILANPHHFDIVLDVS